MTTTRFLQTSLLLLAAHLLGGVVYANPWQEAVVLDAMHRVNKYQQAHPWKADDRNWIRGTYYTGVMAFYQVTEDPALLNQALAWADKHQWQVGTENQGGNRLTCVQTYLQLYEVKQEPHMIAPTIAWLASDQPNSPAGARVWYREGGRRYADSLYVGPPALAMLAQITGEDHYLETMDCFYRDVASQLFDPDEGLMYRDARFWGQRNAHGNKIFWARGNGWVMGSFPRILPLLPADYPSRPFYEHLYRTMARAVLDCQGQDGLWRPNLGDANDIPFGESSSTGFFCYSLAWGLRNGILDRDTTLPALKKAWAALTQCIRADGKVQWVQPVGDRPRAIDQDSTHEYASGTFLLAGSEVLKMIREKQTSLNPFRARP